jgi:hypothetical protein
VIKRYQGKRVVDVTRRMAQGCLETALALLEGSRGGTKLNTAFIERLNATFRSRLAVLVRRSRALIRNPETLEPLMYLMGSVYNFCTEHKSLRLPGIIGGHKWIANERLPSLLVLPIIFGLLRNYFYFGYHRLVGDPKHRGRRSQAEKALIARWCHMTTVYCGATSCFPSSTGLNRRVNCLSTCHCANDPQWFSTADDFIRQLCSHRLMRQILSTRKEPDKRPAFFRTMVANSAAQHRVALF